jgi:hypothetical protein
MKRMFVLLLAVAGMVGAQGVQAQTAPAIGADGGLQVAWVSPSAPACSATVTASCVAGYTEVLTPPFGPVVTLPPCSATVTGNCLSAASTIFTYRPSGGLYCGSWSATVVVNWLDASGAPAVSVATPAVATPAGSTTEPCPFVASPVSSATGKLVK